MQIDTFPSSSRRSARWTSKAHASTWALLGGLTLLAALSAYAVEVYAESATYCGALVQRGVADLDSFCAESLYDDRRRLVTGLAAMGTLLLAVAGYLGRRARREAEAEPQVEDFSWPAYLGTCVACSVFLPFAHLVAFVLALAFADQGLASSTGLPTGWRHLSLALGVSAVCLFMSRHGLAQRSALAAAGLAVPVTLAMQIALGVPVESFTNDASARVTAPAVWLSAVPVVVGVLSVVAAAQCRGWRAPRPRVGVLAVLISSVAATVALMPQLLPAYREAQGGGPSPRGGLPPELWLPIVVGAAVACVVAIAVGYRKTGDA